MVEEVFPLIGHFRQPVPRRCQIAEEVFLAVDHFRRDHSWQPAPRRC